MTKIQGGPGISQAFASSTIRSWNARRQAAFERDNTPTGTVFIDSINGSDSNSGATPALAYATIGKLTSAGVVAGSRIMLRRGSTFTISAFTLPTLTGTPSPTNRTVIGSYGSGPLPVITGNIFQITAAGVGGSYIDIQDVKFTANGGGYALFIYNATAQTDCRVKRCEFGPHTGTGGIIMGVIGGLVEDCNFHDIWSNVEYPSGGGNGVFLTSGSDNTEVRYNMISNCYKGLLTGNTFRDVVFHHNVVIKCRVNGIDMGGGGVVAHPPKIYNNFVWHSPTTPNGHGIDTQGAAVGPIWRNNIVYCDYTNATATNVQLYCIDSTSYASVDTDYNLGWQAPGCTAPYGKLGTTTYATLADWQAALNGTSYAGKEAHSLAADPLIANPAGGLYFPLPGSPAIDYGVVVGGVNDQYLGAAPELGAYEVG